eukprot:scaffold61285_cov30-Tisochrysis_lutea.AAC.5
MKGINPPVQISGQLVIPNREQELAAAARVFNSFLLGKPTPLIAQVAHSSQPFYTVSPPYRPRQSQCGGKERGRTQPLARRNLDAPPCPCRSGGSRGPAYPSPAPRHRQ